MSPARMSPVAFRPCSEADCETVKNLVAQCPPLTVHTSYTYWAILRYFGDLCVLAEDTRGAAAAFISAIPSTRIAGTLLVWQIAVRADLRGQRLAGELLKQVGASAQQMQTRRLQFSIEAENQASLGAFTSFAKAMGSAVTPIEEVGADEAKPEMLYEIVLGAKAPTRL